MSNFMQGLSDSVSDPSKWFDWETQTNATAAMVAGGDTQAMKEQEKTALEQANSEAAKKAAEEKAAADALTAAAEAEAEKLRQRKGMKATMLSGTNQDTLGTAPTNKAALLG